MPKRVLLLVIPLFFAILAVITYLYCFNNKLCVKNDDIYAGRIPVDVRKDKISHEMEFLISNYGIRHIEILSAKTSCGCTSLKYPKIINAFSTVKISAKIEISPHQLHGQSIEIIIENTSDKPLLLLKGSIDVGNYYAITPSEISFGKKFKKESNIEKITILSSSDANKDSNINILEIPEALNVSIEEIYTKEVNYKDASKSKWTIFVLSVSLNDANEIGAHTENIKVEISNSQETFISKIPVKWEILPDAFFHGKNFIFSRMETILPVSISYNKKILTRPISKFKNGDLFTLIDTQESDTGATFIVKYVGDGMEDCNLPFVLSFAEGPSISTNLIYIKSLQ